MLTAYLLTAIGLPVRARVKTSGGVPFPCQDHACGCLTAEQCHEHCCCYTAVERLAWARRHGVEPDAALVAQAAAERHRADHDAGGEHDAPRSCCAHHAAEAPGDVDAPRAPDATACGRPDERPAEGQPTPSLSTKKCMPISSLWCVVGAVLLPVNVCWQFQWNVVERIVPSSAPLDALDLSPPVPPPRV